MGDGRVIISGYVNTEGSFCINLLPNIANMPNGP